MLAGRARLRAAIGALTAALFLVFVVELAPHLVHHLFDSHQPQAECPFATVAERQHAVPATAVAVVSAAAWLPLPLPLAPDLPVVTRATAPARAPPVSAS